MKKIIFLTLLISILISCNKDDDQIIVDPELTVTDADGNVYQTITVGGQIWMLDEDLPFDYYGAMYNHFAIESGKIAPVGWRMPTSQDFIELENYLTNNGQSGTEGEALKTEAGWLDPAGNGTDAIGFKGLPNGYINALGGPTLGGGICTWATSDVSVQNGTRTVINLFDTTTIIYENNAIQIGAGIRCIKE